VSESPLRGEFPGQPAGGPGSRSLQLSLPYKAGAGRRRGSGCGRPAPLVPAKRLGRVTERRAAQLQREPSRAQSRPWASQVSRIRCRDGFGSPSPWTLAFTLPRRGPGPWEPGLALHAWHAALAAMRDPLGTGWRGLGAKGPEA
jgi:hypothetical protein